MMNRSPSSFSATWIFLLTLVLGSGTTTVMGQQDIIMNNATVAGTGPARTSCDASFSAPCSRVNSEWLATNTAQMLSKRLVAGAPRLNVFADITKGRFNMETNFYPFVFDRVSGECIAHGANPTLVGRTLDEIFDDMGIGFSLSDELHRRFVSAAEQGGGWVQYMWRETQEGQDQHQEDPSSAGDGPINNKVAFVTALTDEFYIGVGYANEQLPLDLPCSETHDSWCSINNVRSLVGKAETRLNEALSLEQFEATLYEISFNRDEYFVPGGHYLFMYEYDGPLKAHAHLHRFAGNGLEYIFENLNRVPEEGAELHVALRAAAEGKGKGWVQYPWKNKIDEPEYTKIAYVVRIEFMGQEYYLGCGFNFIMGDIVPATSALELGSRVDLQEEKDLGDDNQDESNICPGFNLPCAFGSTLQLTSHALSHTISSPLPTGEMFADITNDPQFKVGSSYVFIWDYNATNVAHGGIPQLVGSNTSQAETMLGFTDEALFSIHENIRATAESGGGYVVYDWPNPNAPGEFLQKASFVFQLALEGRNYYGGVGFDHIRAPLQLELDTGTQQDGDMIPCSSQYGSTCSEVNSQAILGQALGDLLMASSQTKVRVSQSFPDNTTVQTVLDRITAGNELYKVNDFHVAVFALDQALCYSTEERQTVDRRDESGCCVAHGENPEFVGKTWQDILDNQLITSIRGRDLHDRLIGETDRGGQWMQYSWAQSSGGAQTKIAFSSRFSDGIENQYYVMVEYFGKSPPSTCDACPSGMACTEPGQYFCEPQEEDTSFVQTTGFVILMIVVLGVPCLGFLFCYCGKKREEYQNKAQLEAIGNEMQTMSKKMEDEKKSASRANKLVASLFPQNVHERILEQLDEEESRTDSDMEEQLRPSEDDPWKSRPLVEKKDAVSSNKTRPIADLFPEATISFADIVGFTAWSSTREPSQVFELLETVYRAFDKIANRMKVFKVETVGDCYVAVCGLPEPRTDHAAVMARFASASLTQFKMIVASKTLEVELGPGTSDLKIRIGLHSGPVTAGVLRGDKGRFQLFGDTVNTAARMESTGAPDRIHLSQETVDQLLDASKSHWVTMRDDKVVAKGKGILNTYWLQATAPDLAFRGFSVDATTETASSTSSGFPHESNVRTPSPNTFVDQNQGLVDWNVNIMKSILVEVVARRRAGNAKSTSTEIIQHLEKGYMIDRTSLKEVKEIVVLPKFNANVANHMSDKIEISDTVMAQLRSYVYALSTMYQPNPFHNFQHATHVTMSVVKLMSRIVAPDQLRKEGQSNSERNSDLHDFTYGITSDPLTQFAVLLSALIHDVDHPGVPNAQLFKEGAGLTSVYKQSVAELNSLDLAWNLLMDDQYEALRREIYTTEDEFFRFRQLMVNIVLATDIMDKDLGALRKDRWNKAFGSDCKTEPSNDDVKNEETNRKATIVLEHLIQASDVAHTMQHWNVYLKWNERFFMECYAAYKAGRAEKDPSENWYNGEIGFFDFYIIPLAKKLKDCGVFGVSSAEYLRYAEQNRKQWTANGRDIVASFVEKAYRQSQNDKSNTHQQREQRQQEQRKPYSKAA